MIRRVTIALAALVLAAWTGAAQAEPAAPLTALARMPVKEVTVFKDGHAFVLHAGKMPTDPAGNVVMDYLPAPVLGAFWPYSADKNAKLQSAVASKQKVAVERTALSLPELLEANIGAEVVITEVTDKAAPEKTYPATILSMPARSGQELEAASPPGAGEMLPQKGSLVLLKTEAGVKAVKIDQIRDVTIKGDVRPKAAQEEFRNMLTLKMNWAGKPQPAAEVGLMYLQKGVRWIPSYKVTLDGKGTAGVKLQATLINDLTDLDDVTVHLVVGVPTFRFQDSVDPISLQEQLAQLSASFRRESQTGYAMSNAMMSQVAAPMERQAAPASAGPDMDSEAGGGKKEDLFIYPLSHVTLKKGQRMAVTVSEVSLPYKDVYTLDVPFTPPQEAWGSIMERYRGRSASDPELARLMAAPKVMHKARLTNTGSAPLTTGPALVLLQDRLLAQNLMQYTPPGSQVDLPITAAMDIRVEKTDKEVGRLPNAVEWQKNTYARIDLQGLLKLTNRRGEPVELEVTRYVLGNVSGEPSEGGKAEMVNVAENTDYMPRGGEGPSWWNWYSWPSWWSHFNGVGKITWNVKLDRDKVVELKYDWNYYWR